MKEADPKSFQAKDGEYFAEDKNNLYVGEGIRDKKNTIKNYIEAYLYTNPSLECHNFAFKVEDINGEIILNIDTSSDDTIITCCNILKASKCNSRYDEAFFRKFEDLIMENFDNVKKLTAYYGDNLAYKDKKYYLEKAILKLSNDGRYAETKFYMGKSGPGRHCSLWDMYSGDCLLENEKYSDDQYNEIINQYGLKTNFNKSDGYFIMKDEIDDETEIYLKTIESQFEWRDDWTKWSNLNYKHIPTGIEITVSTTKRNPIRNIWTQRNARINFINI